MSDELLYELKGQSAWITLNREHKRNSINVPMIDEMFAVLGRIQADRKIRSICLTGIGDKVFCAGADLSETFAADDAVEGARKYAALLKRMIRYPKPILARVNGHCLAGGMGLMLASDIVYVRQGVKIGTPEVKVGLFPMMIGALIFRNTLRKQALEMIYTAKTVSSEEAREMGLVTKVLPTAELDSKVHEALEAINANSAVAIEIGKLALADADDMVVDKALDRLCGALGEVLKTEDAAEGLAAFIGKRKPEWKNR